MLIFSIMELACVRKCVLARSHVYIFIYLLQVRDVRLITCNKTRRFKGISYVEFKDPESVPLVSLC
jgi:RNA-binding protein 39